MDINRDKLEKVGCLRVEAYSLVENYGYKFVKGGYKYDLRCWNNCYGVYGGGWRVDTDLSEPTNVMCPSFGDDFDGVVEWIKNNL
jgi:hypothetical protein